MYCKTCGAQIKDGSQFCARCGAQIQTAGGADVSSAPPQPTAQSNPAPSPFAPAQRTADRVFPSQQRKAQQAYGAPQPGAQVPPAWSGDMQPPYGAAPYGAQSGAGIDWEHFQPRTSPKSANRIILAASVLILAVVLMVWTLLIR